MKHKSPYIKYILVIIALIGAVAMAIFSYFVYNTLLTDNTDFEENEVYVHIKSDDTYQDLLNQMDSLLQDVDKFDLVAQKKEYATNIKPGRYKLINGMSNNDILIALRSNNEPFLIAFNNQDRLEKLAQRISEQIEADSSSLIKAMKDKEFLAEHDFPKETALNMYIPNQYELYWNTNAEQFRERMLKEYKRFWNEERLSKADSIDLSPHEVQTLASIIQKETSQAEERPRVAGVYMNRYKKDMKLDADPTVIFALKEQNGHADTTLIKRVLYKHLKIDSPYNTYRNKGIPPGPIAMPDISSIDAVLNYEDHDFYYFVANPEKPGYHKFSKTHAEHIRNKKAYIEWIETLNLD